MATSQARPDRPIPKLNRWLDSITHYGDAGAAWSRDFVADGHDDRVDRLQSQLGPLRAGKIEASRAVIDEAAREIAELEAGVAESDRRTASMMAVERRFLHGVRAYLYYVLDDHDGARDEMLRAYDAVADAISHDRLTLALANHCQEFRLHIVRIERNRGAWDAMWSEIDEVREVTVGQRPLCVLDDGSPIDYDDLSRFFNAMPGFDDADREHLHPILDADARLASFENFVGGILRVPGFVIPYQ